MPLGGRPLLAWVIERLKGAHQLVQQPLELMLATTRDEADDRTAALCHQLGVSCFRGERDDVLSRYLAAAADLGDDDVLIRATADNPLYCPRRTALILERHLAGANDYTCIRNLSYVVPEVMGVGALRRMASLVDGAADPGYCREHVTPYFRQPGVPFRCEQLPDDWQGLRPDLRFTVDTLREYEQMDAFCKACLAVPESVALEDVYRRWETWQQSQQTKTACIAPSVTA